MRSCFEIVGILKHTQAHTIYLQEQHTSAKLHSSSASFLAARGGLLSLAWSDITQDLASHDGDTDSNRTSLFPIQIYWQISRKTENLKLSIVFDVILTEPIVSPFNFLRFWIIIIITY